MLSPVCLFLHIVTCLAPSFASFSALSFIFPSLTLHFHRRPLLSVSFSQCLYTFPCLPASMPIAANTKMCSFQLFPQFLTFYYFSSISTTSMRLSSLFHTSSSFISISPLHVIPVSLPPPFLPIISPQYPSLFSSPITGPSLSCAVSSPFSASHFTCPLSESELPLLTRIVYKVLLSIHSLLSNHSIYPSASDCLRYQGALSVLAVLLC